MVRKLKSDSFIEGGWIHLSMRNSAPVTAIGTPKILRKIFSASRRVTAHLLVSKREIPAVKTKRPPPLGNDGGQRTCAGRASPAPGYGTS